MSLDNLIDEITSKTSNDYEICVIFLLKFLSLIEDECPDIGSRGICIAKKYWIEKSVDQAALNEARIDCWSYLDEKSAATNIEENEFCAVRAVICVLYPELQESNGELLDWFFKWLNSIYRDEDKLIKDASKIIKAI